MQAHTQFDDRPSFRQPTPPMETGICADCNGPAEVVEFWSMSPQNPAVRVLKRQWLCASRPKRAGRFSKIRATTSCKVTTVEVREESLTADKGGCEEWICAIQQAEPATPVAEPAAPLAELAAPVAEPAAPVAAQTAAPPSAREISLDQALDFLAGLDEDILRDLCDLASLLRQAKPIRMSLASRLAKHSEVSAP